MKSTIRCFGNGIGKEFYANYHDNEWGIACHDDRYLFEMLCLEGAQAGLSWKTILKKRSNYKKLFHNFDPNQVASMNDASLEKLLKNPAIIRNRLKIFSMRKNATIFLSIQKEFGSFDTYLWEFVKNKPIINSWKNRTDVPSRSNISDQLSNDLKKRGMSFVGSTIMYAFMQAVGMINDHLENCSFR